MINLKTFIKDQKEFLENDGYSDDYKKRFDELFPNEKMETNSFIETFREYWNEFVNDYGDLAVFEKVITNNVKEEHLSVEEAVKVMVEYSGEDDEEAVEEMIEYYEDVFEDLLDD